MQLILLFFQRYPLQSVFTVLAVLFAGIAEGFGLSMLVPLLTLAFDGSGVMAPAESQSSLGRLVEQLFSAIGLTPSVGMLLFAFSLSILIKALLVLLANKRVGYMVAQLATDLRISLIHALFASRWEYYIHQPIGKFGNAFATEAKRAAEAYSFGIRVIADLVYALVYASIALVVAWQATLGTLAAGMIILYALRYLVTRAKAAGRNQTRIMKAVLALLTDTLQSIKPLRAMAQEDVAIRMLHGETESLNKALQNEVFSKEGLKALQEPLLTIFFSLVLYVTMVWYHVPLTTILVMMFMLVKIIKALQKAQTDYQSMGATESAYWSVQTLIDQTEKEREVITGTTIPSFTETIRVEDVGFSYKGHRVLDSVSLTIPKGAFVAIIGPSGAGKTTIVDLIIGLLIPQQGQVRLDTVPLEDIDLKAWRRTIGYVPQDTLLLHDSIFMNVTLGDPELTENDVERALRDAGAWDFVQGFADGMNTAVGERGSRLSGGQRQRITIARALVRRPQLLVLDEATSALDPASEAEICRTLRRLSGDLTILAISHQTALLDTADLAYRVANGTVECIRSSIPHTAPCR
ncbi:MAG: ABC transporter ATP-binding protein [Desulfopila sp.]